MKKRSAFRRGLLLAAMSVAFTFSAHAAEKVTLQLKWVPQAQFAGYYMGIYAQRINAILVTHRAAEFKLVKLRDRPRQQRMLGFPLRLFFGEARHIQARRAGGAQHQVDPVQRLIRR